MTLYFRFYGYTWKVICNLKYMPSIKNRIWDRYWRLLVISQAERSEKRKWIRWNCKCDCWNEKIVFSDELSSGKSNSCWCLKNEYLHNSWFQFKWNNNRKEQIMKDLYKWSRFKRKWMDISFDKFCEISFSKCHYCWLEYSKTIIDRMKSDEFVNINWIDRLDSNLWYLETNIVPCCKICNTAKSILSKYDFLEWIERVYNYSIK